MIGTLASVFGLALLDSINPSALAVTIYLLLRGGSYVPRVLLYVAAVFATYFVLGVVLMLGLDTVWDYVEGPVAYGVQGVAGVMLLGYAVLAPDRPPEKKERASRSLGLAAIFVLGVTITVVEFSTAFPYLGAIGVLTNADLGVGWWLPVLLLYNAIFVLPPLSLLAAYAAFGERARGIFEGLRARFEKGSRETLLWITGLVGFFLVADSLARLDFFGLV